jgi:hypothetical protein
VTFKAAEEFRVWKKLNKNDQFSFFLI